MRVLITGMSGFAGSHLANLLLEQTHWTLFGISRSTEGNRVHPRMFWWKLDLADAEGIGRFLKYERPDIIVHLAAQANVAASWENPWLTYETNVRGQLNLFQGVIAAKLAPRMLIVSSNEVYGRPDSPSELPFREERPARPSNPYAVSKATQELMALQYHFSHQYDVIIARPFNHIGPGQAERFVASDFAKKIAQIECGLSEPVMQLGNMAAQRDFTDVRDVVRAYLALLQKADGGTILNVCTGKARSIQYLLDLMISRSTVRIEQRIDPSKFRIADTPISFGDASRIRQVTGWDPQIPFEQTIEDILNYWREKMKNVRAFKR
jgi:GDP-4-dehydro-6-deoxy-D-mannose reductase